MGNVHIWDIVNIISDVVRDDVRINVEPNPDDKNDVRISIPYVTVLRMNVITYEQFVQRVAESSVSLV